MKRLLAVGALVVAGSIGSAQAATINFEDIAQPPGANNIGGDQISTGFLFDSFTNHTHLANASFGVDNGSTFLVIDDFVGTNPTTFSQIGGAPFALNSIDVAEWRQEDPGMTPVNINLVWGFDDRKAQTWMSPNAWFALLFFGLPIAVYWPTHLILQYFFNSAPSP